MENMLPADIRIMMLKKGINPYKEVQPRNWNEHQITFSSIRKFYIFKIFKVKYNGLATSEKSLFRYS